MWLDDLDTAFRHLDLYDRFGCPGGHVQAAFRCFTRFLPQIDDKVQNSLSNRIHACWINPNAQPQAAAAQPPAPSTTSGNAAPAPATAPPAPAPRHTPPGPRREITREERGLGALRPENAIAPYQLSNRVAGLS